MPEIPQTSSEGLVYLTVDTLGALDTDTAEFPVDHGTVVTVNCKDNGFSVRGDSVITCSKGRSFTSVNDLPSCKPGEMFTII